MNMLSPPSSTITPFLTASATLENITIRKENGFVSVHHIIQSEIENLRKNLVFCHIEPEDKAQKCAKVVVTAWDFTTLHNAVFAGDEATVKNQLESAQRIPSDEERRIAFSKIAENASIILYAAIFSSTNELTHKLMDFLKESMSEEQRNIAFEHITKYAVNSLLYAMISNTSEPTRNLLDFMLKNMPEAQRKEAFSEIAKQANFLLDLAICSDSAEMIRNLTDFMYEIMSKDQYDLTLSQIPNLLHKIIENSYPSPLETFAIAMEYCSIETYYNNVIRIVKNPPSQNQDAFLVLLSRLLTHLYHFPKSWMRDEATSAIHHYSLSLQR